MNRTLLACAALVLPGALIFAQKQVTITPTHEIPMEFMGLSPAVRDLPPYEPAKGTGEVIAREREDRENEREARKRLHRKVNPNALPMGPDPARQTAGPLHYNDRALDLSVDGQTYTAVNPADANLAVGPNHVIQTINYNGGSYFRIYNKNLTAVQAQATLQSLTGVAGAGDPVVLYDALADRWVMSEFGLSGNRFLIAVSQTADPTGAWYAYNYTTPQFPDYPKYGIWNNCYVVTSNESTPAIYALPRANMLAGVAGTTVRFTVSAYGTIGFQACTPVNFSGGNAPPAGAPAMFMRMADDSWGAAADRLEIWNINYNSATPASSTITGPTYLNTDIFETSLCGYTSFSCVDQPGNANYLDPLREVLMNHIQYRNLSGYEAIACSHAVDVGSDVAGIRWYELHRTGGSGNPWSIYQQGTFSPNTTHRWMSSIAINNNGDIGLAYNVASSTIYPGIWYTGRYAADPLGQMTFAETVVVSGTANNNSNRWGDYNSLDVDPADGTSFYGTACYNPTASWRTRMFKFSFPAQSLSVGVKVKLEGPYDSGTGLMRDSLRVKGLIPLAEPYTALGYTFVGGGGETIGSGILSTTGNNAIVDWVVVELRSSGSNTTVLASKAGLVQRDGDVVGVDGTTPLTFNLPAGNYYVAVFHRNHLRTMTSGTVGLSGSLVTVDFTSSGLGTYGTDARKDVSGTLVLWAGNTFNGALPPRQLKYTNTENDREPILTAIGGVVPTSIATGYLITDVNLDGVVKYTGSANDRDPILINIGGVVPTNTRTEQMP